MDAELEFDARLFVGDFHLDVELAIPTGPVLLVGPNGAGKTTLLRALAGGPVRVDGTLRVHGETWVEAGRQRAPEARGVGYLPQGGALFPHLDVLDNVAFGAPGRSRAERHEKARAALDAHGAGSLTGRTPRTLSGGERQRVALARAMVRQPSLLLLDEPLAALDVRSRREIRHLLTPALRAPGRTGVAATHDPRDVHAWGGTLVLVDDGRARVLGTLAGVLRGPMEPFLDELLSPMGAGSASEEIREV